MSLRLAFARAGLLSGTILLSACAGSDTRSSDRVGSTATAQPTVAVGPDGSCYVLRGMSLKSLVARVNRDTSRQLFIDDPAIGNSRLGGTVCMDSLDSLVPALQRLGLNVVEVTQAIPSASGGLEPAESTAP